MIKILTILIVSLSLQQDSLVGFWVISTNDLIIECYEKDNKFFGKIHWFKDSNPNREKYSEKGVPKSKWKGYVVMSNFTYVDTRLFGKIFDVKNGEEYNAYMEISENTVIVRPYIFFPILNKEMIFQRYKKIK